MNILFVCSRNKKRSLTAETIFKNNGFHKVSSAGTEESAVRKVNINLLLWADIIFVMEKRHKDRLQEKFSEAISTKEIIILNIPDEYEYMDEELIAMLKDMIKPWL